MTRNVTPNIPTDAALNKLPDRFRVLNSSFTPEAFDKARELSVMLVGIGTIGSNLALQLARILPFKQMTIVDADNVEIHNIANQAYGLSSVGKPKVNALEALIRDVNADITIRAINAFWEKNNIGYADMMFIGVDNMTPRRQIFADLPEMVSFYSDARIGGSSPATTLAKIFALTTTNRGRDYYPSSLHTTEEGVPANCSAGTYPSFTSAVISRILENVHQFLTGDPGKIVPETWYAGASGNFMLSQDLTRWAAETPARAATATPQEVASGV